jgi:hypothetical protein
LNVRAAPTPGARDRHRGASLCLSDDRAARGERDEERDDKSGHTSVHSSTTCVCSPKSNSPTDLKTPGYGGMVVRALLFSTFISLQFELGPLSEASIGNVGMRDPNKMAWGTW